jgi:hypothetical protein
MFSLGVSLQAPESIQPNDVLPRAPEPKSDSHADDYFSGVASFTIYLNIVAHRPNLKP